MEPKRVTVFTVWQFADEIYLRAGYIGSEMDLVFSKKGARELGILLSAFSDDPLNRLNIPAASGEAKPALPGEWVRIEPEPPQPLLPNPPEDPKDEPSQDQT